MAIIPDDKDWTWVLRKVCPECSFDAAPISREQLAAIVRDLGASWQAVLDRPDVRDRPSADVWSPLEYGCHVRDVFRLADFRLGLMLDEDAPRFANWDQDATAIDERYVEQDPAVVRAEVAAAAETFAQRLEAVSDAQWPRTGLRSDGAEFTVESFGRYLVHDPIHHLWDVRDQG
jgi:DinB superfamily